MQTRRGHRWLRPLCVAAAPLAVGAFTWAATAGDDSLTSYLQAGSPAVSGAIQSSDTRLARERALGVESVLPAPAGSVPRPSPPPAEQPAPRETPAALADAVRTVANGLPAAKPVSEPVSQGVAVSVSVPAPQAEAIPVVVSDGNGDAPEARIVPTGCNCAQNGGLLGDAPPAAGLFTGGPAPGSGAPCSCGSGGQCVPGQKDCYPCEADHPLGRYLCGVYQCLCCPDHCYEPKWTPITDAAFFVDAVRPQTQTRLRYDAGRALQFPDRSEYFWARADGNGKGPRPRNGLRGETGLRYDDLMLYTEGATGAAGIFTEVPYRSIQAEQLQHTAGFNDMTIGTKALLFDCELLQVGFQFKTFIPIGNFTKGIGVGHVSLEPSLLVGVKLGPETHMQMQLSEWIPIAGDGEYAGSILHTHTSINHTLCKILPNVPLIGTFEYNSYSFQDGAYTDPYLGTRQSSGKTYSSLGPGIRLVVCDKIDFGFGSAFSLSAENFGRQIYRTEFRVRF